MRFLLRPEALRLALASESGPDAALLPVLISCSGSDEVWCLVLSSRSDAVAVRLRRFLDELLVELLTGLSADLFIGLSVELRLSLSGSVLARLLFGELELPAELRLSLSGSVLARLLFGELELPAELRASLWVSAIERLLFVVPSDVLRFLEELPVTLSVSGSES